MLRERDGVKNKIPFLCFVQLFIFIFVVFINFGSDHDQKTNVNETVCAPLFLIHSTPELFIHVESFYIINGIFSTNDVD